MQNQFESYFSELYGSRWSGLLASLQIPERQVARWNQFIISEKPEAKACSDLSGCFEWSGGELPRSADHLLAYYVMDPASVIVARALQVGAGEKILDMCAAPGGKALILAEALLCSDHSHNPDSEPDSNAELTANELSAGRRDRLTKVIQQYIPRKLRSQVWVTGKDGGLFAVHAKNKFDRVLLDAPCSGERHLLQNSKELMEWSLHRSKKLAQRQYALLTAALEAVKPGGRIVYATCSISPLENDQVVERVLKKKNGRLRTIEVDVEISGEKTKQGLQYFPDQFGFGPIYFSVLEKHGTF